MCLVGEMDADSEVGAVESASSAEAEVGSNACDNSSCADVDADDCDVADATDTVGAAEDDADVVSVAEDAENAADGAEDGRDTASLDMTEFPVRAEVFGDIREDGKSQVLFGWIGQWQRERPKGVMMVRQRSGPDA
jgi:hypothetical protein